MKKIILSILLIIVCSHLAQANSSFSVLEMPYDAEGNSRGYALTSCVNNINSVNWNPAGLWDMMQSVLNVNYSLELEQGNGFFITYGGNIFQQSIALFMKYYSLSFKEYLVDAYLNPVETGDNIQNKDLLFGISYAKAIFQEIRLGITGKYGYEKLDDVSYSGLLMDMGGIFIFPFFSYGLVLKNMGFGFGNNNLPFKIQSGISTKFVFEQNQVRNIYISDIIPSFDLIYYNKKISIAFGIDNKFILREYGAFHIRAGYIGLLGMGGGSGLTGGLGLNLKKIDFDYGLVSQGDLGLTHKFSLTYKF